MEKRKKETIWFIKYFKPVAMLKANTHVERVWSIFHVALHGCYVAYK